MVVVVVVVVVVMVVVCGVRVWVWVCVGGVTCRVAGSCQETGQFVYSEPTARSSGLGYYPVTVTAKQLKTTVVPGIGVSACTCVVTATV